MSTASTSRVGQKDLPFRPCGIKSIMLTSIIRQQQFTVSTASPFWTRGRVIWSPTVMCHEQTNFYRISWPSCWYHAHHVNGEHLQNHSSINPAIPPPSYLRKLVSIPLLGSIFIVTTNNLVPDYRNQGYPTSFHIAVGYFIYHIDYNSSFSS